MADVKDRARSGPKARDMAVHARQRFAQRFDVTLTTEARKQILWAIQHGHSTFIKKQSNAISLHRVSVEGHDVVVVYDKIRAAIVTALYPEDETE